MTHEPRVALVTGVSSGLGRAIALELARHGTTVGLVARRRDRVEALAEEIRGLGAGAHVLAGDLRQSAFAARVVDDLVARTDRLDLLVNNAGAPTPSNAEVASDDDFDAALALNLRAAYRLSYAAFPHLQRTLGSVVNISSAGVARTIPIDLVYLTSKGALDTMTRGMAKKWAPTGVRVNAVSPGLMPTEIFEAAGFSPQDARDEVARAARQMQPMPQLGAPEDVARAVLFLGSPSASFITGTILAVDGGLGLGG